MNKKKENRATDGNEIGKMGIGMSMWIWWCFKSVCHFAFNMPSVVSAYVLHLIFFTLHFFALLFTNFKHARSALFYHFIYIHQLQFKFEIMNFRIDWYKIYAGLKHVYSFHRFQFSLSIAGFCSSHMCKLQLKQLREQQEKMNTRQMACNKNERHFLFDTRNVQ